MTDLNKLTSNTTTQTTNINKSDDNIIATNPDGVLGKDDFLKLLLVELEHQDPTAPMDSEKILAQTSQLATLEAQQNTNKVMSDFASQFAMSQNMNAVSAIGKQAKMDNSLILEEGKDTNFDLYFNNKIQSGSVGIYDQTEKLIKTINLDAQKGGSLKFTWDGKDDNGVGVDAGKYKVVATYNSPDGENHQSEYGTYKIESVKFEESQALVKLGGQYIPFSEIKEIVG